MQANKEVKKLYYSIGEVSEITKLKQYVLRYWETEFVQLKPAKNSAGNRNYRKSDIDLILKIKDLLYNKHFTIKGAKQYLKDKYSTKNRIDNIVNIQTENQIDKDLLLNLKKGLQDIIDLIDKAKK